MGNARIQIRRGSVDFWESENPILHSGEPGFEKDTGRLKIGNGITSWNELEYFSEVNSVNASDATLKSHIDSQYPHPVYDDGPSLYLLYQNAKV